MGVLWTAPTLRHQGASGCPLPLQSRLNFGAAVVRRGVVEPTSPIGLDIAESGFQIYGVVVDGAVVMRKRITRAKLLDFFATLPSCLVGIEACPTAHYWSRRLQALGHTVRLLPPSYVKAYLKRSKNDANDAAAICEA